MLDNVKAWVGNKHAAEVHVGNTLEIAGPGMWTDTVHKWLYDTYGAKYADPLLTGTVKWHIGGIYKDV